MSSPNLPVHNNQLGPEARAKHDDQLDLRLWLRLFSCSSQIEREIAQRLRSQFATSLPRFDYLAQLERYPAGLRMNVLSRHLMVTGGNVTGLTDQLVKDGLVERCDDPDDRRSYLVKLTEQGRADFSAMAQAHESWLAEIFSQLGNKEALYEQLGALRLHLSQTSISK